MQTLFIFIKLLIRKLLQQFPNNVMCQPMVTGTNSTPIGIPNLGYSKETLCNANSSVMIQHGCENSPAVEQLHSVTAQP